jgi:hypothetical protein
MHLVGGGFSNFLEFNQHTQIFDHTYDFTKGIGPDFLILDFLKM